MKKIITVCDFCKTRETCAAIQLPAMFQDAKEMANKTKIDIHIELCEDCMQQIIQQMFNMDLMDNRVKANLLSMVKKEEE